MPGLLPSPMASLEVLQSACAPIALWPSTPTPKAEAYALHSDVVRRPLLPNAPQYDNALDQGLVPALFESEDHRADALAGKSSFFSRQCSQSVKVKNTFIDGFLDDEEQNDGPAVAACKSWCAGFTRQGSATWSCGSTSDGESLTAPSSPEGAAPPRLSAEPPSPPPSPPSPVRKSQASAGADLHGTGRCRPCGWFWKPEGCAHGAECCHCHMCPEGELKARKKAKLAAMRTRKHVGSANDSQ
jgi:hypothetical protein